MRFQTGDVLRHRIIMVVICFDAHSGFDGVGAFVPRAIDTRKPVLGYPGDKLLVKFESGELGHEDRAAFERWHDTTRKSPMAFWRWISPTAPI